jgi:hypothetical protein
MFLSQFGDAFLDVEDALVGRREQRLDHDCAYVDLVSESLGELRFIESLGHAHDTERRPASSCLVRLGHLQQTGDLDQREPALATNNRAQFHGRRLRLSRSANISRRAAFSARFSTNRSISAPVAASRTVVGRLLFLAATEARFASSSFH